MKIPARAWAVGAAAVWAALAVAGCDFDQQILDCAREERCLIDAGVPTPRFPRNGAGLGSPSANLPTTAYGPTRPYFAWDFDGDDTWHFRIQLNRCAPGESFDQCPFTESTSERKPDSAATTLQYDADLQIGNRYLWRVRACDSKLAGKPCGPWSVARYFDVGRPEAMPNDLAGRGRGDLVVAGADGGNLGAQEKVYLYSGSNTAPSFWKELVVGPPTGVTVSYTVVVSGAGDLNGDGYSDLAVGYQPDIIAAPQRTPVDVYLGGLNGPDSAARIHLQERPDDFGTALGRAGDVNGDGLSDLVVCQRLQRRALLFFGSSSGPVDSLEGDAQLFLPNAGLGTPMCAFAALADVDSDGFDEIAVGMENQLLVFHGHQGGGAWTDVVELPVPSGAGGFGSSMAGGDFNGDGHGDLVTIGGNLKAYLYLGNPQWFTSPLAPVPVVFNIPPGVVAAVGDMNGDGLSDLAAGGGTTGRVQIFLGRITGAPAAGPILQDSSLQSFGIAFAGVGDVTDDNFEDLAVGSTSGVIVYRGGANDLELGMLTDPIIPRAGSVQFGLSIASGH